MKQAIAFFLLLGAAGLLLMTGMADRNVVWADDCKASATATATQIKDNRYWITSEVTSGDCAKLQCRGFVHYVISYHTLNNGSGGSGGSGGTKGQATALSDFKIDIGNQKGQIKMEYVADRGAVIDAVKVESISCLTTAP